MPVRLRKAILDIADSPLRRPTEEIRSIAQLLADNYDDLRLRETFADLALQLVVEQPLKTPFVAAVVLVLNTLSHAKPAAAQNGDDGDVKMEGGEGGAEPQKEEQPPLPCTAVVDDVLARVAAAVEEKVNVGEWRTVKLYLKFLACLQNCLAGEGVFPILDTLFDHAVELQTASSEDVSALSMEEPCVGNLLTHVPHDRRLEPSWSRSSCSRSHTPSPQPPASTRRTLPTSLTRRILLLPSLIRFRP